MLGALPPPPFDPGFLRLATDLRRAGIEPSRGEGWHHVRHGVWVDATVWVGLDPTQRHAAFVHATSLQRRLDAPLIAAGTSAAALWGLPRIEAWPSHVRHLVTGRRVRGSAIMRPMVGLETDPQEVHGVLVTPVARTVIDLARSGSLVTAVAAADHALRHELCSPSELIAEVAAIPRRAAGRTSAALTRDLADPLSMSAGESLSRVQMFHLNLPKPILQRELHDGEGLIGLGDFWWEGVVGEFDGKVKYRIPAGATAEEASRILWAEKRREDRIRTRARMARWVWFDALRPDRLLQKLAHVGIRPVARPGWFDLGSSNAS
ncbi:hypothetical protein JNB_05864 [Janibacter sp. HTCC2649]|uniref:hypothetical protein n=1 Tax=Janibacter sp. HTCC2649 TaxID=313589 RepID=UPI0000670B26|nr:hypothetical protein [Janibacter sp. HTCC2649]EAP99670.1 hypothetical protein JNB_05864 [Janibacter sp. HTCC2649]